MNNHRLISTAGKKSVYWLITKRKKSSFPKQRRLWGITQSPRVWCKSQEIQAFETLHVLLVSVKQVQKQEDEVLSESRTRKNGAMCDCSSLDTGKLLSNWWNWNHRVWKIFPMISKCWKAAHTSTAKPVSIYTSII